MWLLLTLLTLYISQVFTQQLLCPAPCTCTGTKVDCSGKGLTGIPTLLPSHTQTLDVSSNRLTYIGDDIFNAMTSLTTLTLHNNTIECNCIFITLLKERSKGINVTAECYINGVVVNPLMTRCSQINGSNTVQLIGEERKLKNNSLLRTLDVGKEYIVRFQVNFTSATFGNVIRFSLGGEDASLNYGNGGPTIYFGTGDTRSFRFYSVINGRKYQYDTPTSSPYPLNTWITIEVKQVSNENNYTHSIIVNGDVLYTVNNQAANKKNVKIYAGGPTSPAADGYIRLLTILSKPTWNARELIGREQSILQGKLITTLDALPKEFKITFDFKPTVRTSHRSILRFTTSNNDSVSIGGRIPLVYLYSNCLYVRSAINGNGDYHLYISSSATINKWYSVEITQQIEAGQYRYSIKFNHVVTNSLINYDARLFENVTVYASDPWWSSQPGLIRNLRIHTKDINYCASNPCHVDATCVNVLGYYKCKCNSGFEGNGKECRGWTHQQSNVCFGAKGNNFGAFTLKEDGTLTAIKIVHNFGDVSCRAGGQSNWGCGGNDIGTLISTANNVVIFPKNVSADGWFSLRGYNSKSKEIVFKDPAKVLQVRNGKQMRVWYGEDFKHTTEQNNTGISCANVYAKISRSTHCASNPCHAKATCTSMFARYKCECRSGWEGDGTNCTDINECEKNPCHYNSTCRNLNGTYECKCAFWHGGNGTDCVGIYAFQLIGEERELERNKLLGSVDVGEEYSVKFQVNLTSAAFGSVLRFSLGGDKASQNYGDGGPTIYFEGGKFRFYSLIDGLKVQYDTPLSSPYSLDRWITVEVKQVLEAGKFIRSIIVNGEVLNTAINNKAVRNINVKIHAGGLSYPAAGGFIRLLTLTKGMWRELIGQEQSIVRGKLITTLDALQKEFIIIFDFKATYTTTRSSILHFTTFNANTGAVGGGIPFVYMYYGNLYITFAVNGNSYHSQIIGSMSGVWHSVEISQQEEGGRYRYSVTVDGKVAGSVITNDARVFRDVRVYAGDPWYTAQPGFIRNLRHANVRASCRSRNNCHVNATCTERLGGYECKCNTGFEGNGTQCRGILLF